jgi:hydroxymethylbilane synthase
MKIRLGTRSSKLALTQAHQVARWLKKVHAGLQVELINITTAGDKERRRSLQSFGGTGVFVKELEQALLEGRIDLAVHSLKDLPVSQPKGLALAVGPTRADPRDVAVTRGRRRLEDLPAGSVIGSGSPRRRAQLKHRFPQLKFAEIRGNVETRIGKVAAGDYDGTILARAGLGRLKLLGQAAQTLPLDIVLPAPGQGALGLEYRAANKLMPRLLRPLENRLLAVCVAAERAALKALGGGCHLPLGALAGVSKTRGKNILRLRVALGLPDGSKLLRAEASMRFKGRTPSEARARQLGAQAAKLLLKQGGRKRVEVVKIVPWSIMRG